MQQRTKDQEKYIDELRTELSGQKTKYSRLLKSSLYHSDVEAMHRRISQSEVERIKECFNCCRPYEQSKSYSGQGHERSHSQFSNYGS